MRYFVTGASGWIGSAVTRRLVEHGHQVLGLTRSDTSAAAVEALGAEVHRGDLDDPAGLAAAAATTDGVIHLAYNHDFSDMEGAARTDRAVIDAMGDALAGTDKPLLIASGVAGFAGGRTITEADRPAPGGHPRSVNAEVTLALAERGVRSGVLRFAPTVHGPGDGGFVAMLVAIARQTGTSAYVGDGSGRWPAVHVLDAADLVRRAAKDAPAGSVLHAVAEEGVPTKDIAAAIGRGLDLPVTSVDPDQAMDHFGWLGRFFGADMAASNAATRQLLGWAPTHPGLIEDLAAGAYS